MGSFSARMPSPQTTSWERGAKLVQNTDTSNQYLEHIREVHDPSLHLKTIEEELLGTMGKALGKQGEKILVAVRKMNNEKERYDRIISDLDSNLERTNFTSLPQRTQQELVNIILNYNRLQKEAMHARWELIVHRQAIGFIVNNHKSVTEKFPIPELWDLPHGCDAGDFASSNVAGNKTSNASKNEPVKRNFGDQLDWWQNIGRWK
jgi:hypothetical protein